MPEKHKSLKARLKSLLRPAEDHDAADSIHYEGSAILRILKYMKPHLGTFSVCLILVLVATGLEIWRPIIIGDAIDEFITGQTSRTVLSSGRTEWAAGEMADARFQGSFSFLFHAGSPPAKAEPGRSG